MRFALRKEASPASAARGSDSEPSQGLLQSNRLLGSRKVVKTLRDEEKQRSGRLIFISKIGESEACFDEA